jgi:hypothetical protein
MASKTLEGKRFKVYQGEYPGYITMADESKVLIKCKKANLLNPLD